MSVWASKFSIGKYFLHSLPLNKSGSFTVRPTPRQGPLWPSLDLFCFWRARAGGWVAGVAFRRVQTACVRGQWHLCEQGNTGWAYTEGWPGIAITQWIMALTLHCGSLCHIGERPASFGKLSLYTSILIQLTWTPGAESRGVQVFLPLKRFADSCIMCYLTCRTSSILYVLLRVQWHPPPCVSACC